MKSTSKYFYTAIEDNKMGYGSQTMMVSMDCTSKKYFIYSEGGLLFNRIDYALISEKYGEQIQVSNNGRIFVFQKPDKTSEINILEMTID